MSLVASVGRLESDVDLVKYTICGIVCSYWNYRDC